MRSPCQSGSTRLFGPTAVFLSHNGSCYRVNLSQHIGLTPPAQLRTASRQTDTLAALCRTTASFSASSSPSKTQTLPC